MSQADTDLMARITAEQRRAERLLEHSLAGLHRAEQLRRADRDRIALQLEQLCLPLEELSGGLAALIEDMARDRQDNRLLRWQGRLQQLLTPLDLGVQGLRDLVALLDQPLDRSTPVDGQSTPTRKRYQLQQLLIQRQKQVLQLQTEVRELQLQLFAAQAASEPEAAVTPAEDAPEVQPRTPNIFS